MERDQASKFINDLLKLMVSRNGSDLFITGDFPPAMKVELSMPFSAPLRLPAKNIYESRFTEVPRREEWPPA